MYKITPVNEPNGEGNGWDECPEAQATGLEVSDIKYGYLLGFYESRAEAESHKED